jgi:tellurite resistance protein TerC
LNVTSLPLWIGFNLFVLALLALDLGVFHRKAHVVTAREAATWSAVWIAIAMAFNVGIWHFLGDAKAVEFLTGYVIEKSLSVDNIFVFAVLLSYFAVPADLQHRVLFWGILGALVLRAAFIAAGAALLAQFHWVIYVFGGFLVITGFKMMFAPDQGIDPEKNPALKLVRRFIPVTPGYEGKRFFVRRNGVLLATPLFLVLVLVDIADIIFAVDSIPAIFAVTRDPFIVYTSNVFAILGLRSLYFLLAGVMDKFEYLKVGLAAILIFVGTKMTIVEWYAIPSGVSLAVVGALLAASIVASLWKARRRAAEVRLSE